MKYLVLCLFGAFGVFMSACQSTEEIETPDDYSCIDEKDANRKLSHQPTGEVYVKASNQSVKIDFSIGNFEYNIVICDRMVISYNIDDYRIFANGSSPIMGSMEDIENILFDGTIYDIPTVGKLVELYKIHPAFYESSMFNTGYLFPPEVEGNYVFSKFHYALAQECFKDAYSSQTRKAVLQMVLDKGTTNKYDGNYIKNSIFDEAKKSGVFLMAVILIKEEDAYFIKALRDNPDLQRSISLSYNSFDSAYWIGELCDTVNQFAINFLSNQNEKKKS